MKHIRISKGFERNAAYRKGYDTGWHDVTPDANSLFGDKEIVEAFKMGMADGKSDHEDAWEEHKP